jgi:hypothetical protein
MASTAGQPACHSSKNCPQQHAQALQSQIGLPKKRPNSRHSTQPKRFSGQSLAKTWGHSCHDTLSKVTFLGILASSDRRQSLQRKLQAKASSPTLHLTCSALRGLIRVRTNGKACAGGKEGNLVAQKHCRCGKERQTKRISDRMNERTASATNGAIAVDWAHAFVTCRISSS